MEIAGREPGFAMSGETVLHQLSCRDKLLFSQAVYELGNDAWHKVSEILSNHPLIKLSESVLAPNVRATDTLRASTLTKRVQSCAAIYAQLTAELPDDTCVLQPTAPRYIDATIQRGTRQHCSERQTARQVSQHARCYVY